MKKWQPLIYALLISIGILIGNSENKNTVTDSGKISNILQMIDEHYVDTINHNIFEDKAINAILKELDPHYLYLIDQWKLLFLNFLV